MNIRIVARIVSAILIVVGLAMFTAVAVAWLMNDPQERYYRVSHLVVNPHIRRVPWIFIPAQRNHYWFQRGLWHRYF